MTIADILAIISGLIIVGLGLPSLFMVIKISFPHIVERAVEQLENRPKRAFASGLLAFFGLFLLVSTLANLPNGLFKFLAFLLALAGLALSMVGGTGLATHLAARYRLMIGSLHSRPAHDLYRSALVVELAVLLPLVGWFIVLPIVLLLMLGAGCCALLPRRQRTVPFAQIKSEGLSSVS